MVEISENFLEFFFDQFSYLALNAPFSRRTKPYGGIPREGGRGKQGRQGRRKGAVGRIAKNILSCDF
jgi:hypothetical protein